MNMIGFKSYTVHLNEASVRSADFPKVATLVKRYMTKYLGKTYTYPTEEVYTSGGTRGVGIRFFFGKTKSFRLNWVRTVNSSMGLVSMDYWDGATSKPGKPTQHIKFNQAQSIVKILPFVKEMLLGHVKQSGVFVDEGAEYDDNELLSEAVYTERDILGTIQNTINALSSGIQIRQQTLNGGNKKYGPKWNDVQRVIRETYPSLFKARPGNKQLIIDADDVKKIDPKTILAVVMGSDGALSFTLSGGKAEVVDVPGMSEADVDRMSYEEQLDSLKTGMRLLMSNATNAIFLGGRGGTGKTQTVEDMLKTAGKSDGAGYTKITGSATPSGIYRILHTHKSDIILFDDSDSALADQEGRNLFKAASDTKKSRKISWMKGGKSFVDPDDYDEDGEDDKLPRSFDFTGKIIFISNMPLAKLDPDGALRTRGYVINIDPTNEEIYAFMDKIVDKIPLDVDYALSKEARLEVVEVLKQRRISSKTANLRSLVRGLNTRAGVEQQGGSSDEWRKFVKMFA